MEVGCGGGCDVVASREALEHALVCSRRDAFTGAVFGIAAVSKGRNASRFINELRLHGVVPDAIVGMMPGAVALAEGCVAILLIVGARHERTRPAAVAASAAFLTSVTAYLTMVAVTRGISLTCGCVSGIESPVGTALARNASLLLLMLPLVLRSGRSRRPPATA